MGFFFSLDKHLNCAHSSSEIWNDKGVIAVFFFYISPNYSPSKKIIYKFLAFFSRNLQIDVSHIECAIECNTQASVLLDRPHNCVNRST